MQEYGNLSGRPGVGFFGGGAALERDLHLVWMVKPHLVRELVAYPIEAMIAGGLLDENDVNAQGVAYANKEHRCVEPSPEGRKWSLEQLPKRHDGRLPA